MPTNHTREMKRSVLAIFPIIFAPFFLFLVLITRFLIRHNDTIQIRYKRRQCSNEFRYPRKPTRSQNFLIFQFLANGEIP